MNPVTSTSLTLWVVGREDFFFREGAAARWLGGGGPGGVEVARLPWRMSVDMFGPMGSWDSWFLPNAGDEVELWVPKLRPSWLGGWFWDGLVLKGRADAGEPVSSGFVSALFLLLTCWSWVSSVSISWSEEALGSCDRCVSALTWSSSTEFVDERPTRLSWSDISSESVTTGSRYLCGGWGGTCLVLGFGDGGGEGAGLVILGGRFIWVLPPLTVFLRFLWFLRFFLPLAISWCGCGLWQVLGTGFICIYLWSVGCRFCWLFAQLDFVESVVLVDVLVQNCRLWLLIPIARDWGVLMMQVGHRRDSLILHAEGVGTLHLVVVRDQGPPRECPTY